MKSRGYGVGGSLANKLKRGKKILEFIGNEIYRPIAHEVAPVTRPIFQAGSDAAVATIERKYNPGKSAADAMKTVSDLFSGHTSSPVSGDQKVDQVAKASAAAVIANSFQPFKPPTPTPVPSMIGVPTGAVSLRGASAPTSGRSFHMAGGALYLGKIHHLSHGKGLGSPALLLHPSHPALRSAWQNESFLEQIPQVFKDHKRMGAGFELM